MSSNNNYIYKRNTSFILAEPSLLRRSSWPVNVEPDADFRRAGPGSKTGISQRKGLKLG
jgi:hypothetical protein